METGKFFQRTAYGLVMGSMLTFGAARGTAGTMQGYICTESPNYAPVEIIPGIATCAGEQAIRFFSFEPRYRRSGRGEVFYFRMRTPWVAELKIQRPDGSRTGWIELNRQSGAMAKFAHFQPQRGGGLHSGYVFVITGKRKDSKLRVIEPNGRKVIYTPF